MANNYVNQTTSSNAIKRKEEKQKNHVKTTKDMYISLSRHLKREFSDETKPKLFMHHMAQMHS